jgi:hypothetical protein
VDGGLPDSVKGTSKNTHYGRRFRFTAIDA